MRRKKSINDNIPRWGEIVGNEICGNHNRSAFVSVIDKKTHEVCAFQIGEKEDIPFEHIAYLLSSGTRVAIIDTLLKVLGKEAVEELTEEIKDRMEEMDERAVEEEKIDNGEVICQECLHFTEKSMGFGYCKYHPKGFDGLDTNRENNNGRVCKHMDRK